MQNSNGPIIGIGMVGFLIGGFVGFLARPSAFLIGQLPFEHVISRGTNLKGMDQMLAPIAQQSFNITLIGAIIGTISGIVIGYFAIKKNGNDQIKVGSPLAKKITINSCNISVELSDSRTLKVPLVYFPQLLNASDKQREKYKITDGGTELQWEEIGENISVRGLLIGKYVGLIPKFVNHEWSVAIVFFLCYGFSYMPFGLNTQKYHSLLF